VDAKIRFELRIQFHRLEALRNCTSIYVTHDYVEALSLGDRIAIIDTGQIVQVGTPKQIYHQPKNVFVARLVGQPHINLLDATLEAHGDDASLKIPQGGFNIPIPAKLRRTLEQAGAPQELTVGIRPMDISINSKAEEAIARVRSDVFEPFGSLGLLSVKAQDIYLELLLGPDLTVEPDSQLGVDFRADRMIFFDPESHHNLLWNEDYNG
jgi:multiple sugar transport system ATP-binding protein